ncbi:MAG: hypothetical protein CMN54_03895 [SAR324 cluster bacterium]|uniref:Uncharacterized protein n=1 Tax=SAR324 cluster bacterium TaxID=2024889 RepID=A0A2D6YHC0_9DELT|nr:hypothetical protein [SAR324 cluster bacterium]
MSELLVDLADRGKAPLRYDGESLPPTLKIRENLRLDLVAWAFEQLTSRYNAEKSNDEDTHLIIW